MGGAQGGRCAGGGNGRGAGARMLAEGLTSRISASRGIERSLPSGKRWQRSLVPMRRICWCRCTRTRADQRVLQNAWFALRVGGCPQPRTGAALGLRDRPWNAAGPAHAGKIPAVGHSQGPCGVALSCPRLREMNGRKRGHRNSVSIGWCRRSRLRGGCRLNISVSASFVWRCLSGSALAPFPHPAHR